MMVNSFSEIAKQSGIKSWDLMMADIAVGHDSAKLFTAAAQAERRHDRQDPVRADHRLRSRQLHRAAAWRSRPRACSCTTLLGRHRADQAAGAVQAVREIQDGAVGLDGQRNPDRRARRRQRRPVVGAELLLDASRRDVNADFVKAFEAALQAQADLYRRRRLSVLRAGASGDPEGRLDRRRGGARCA